MSTTDEASSFTQVPGAGDPTTKLPVGIFAISIAKTFTKVGFFGGTMPVPEYVHFSCISVKDTFPSL
jgi:hypothetical protein